MLASRILSGGRQPQKEKTGLAKKRKRPAKELEWVLQGDASLHTTDERVFVLSVVLMYRQSIDFFASEFTY